METHSTAAKGKLLQTIPVEQAAVTVAVHLPKAARSKAARRRDAWL
jgi:hypothetical protein